MTPLCALKFVPRSIPLGVVAATFSLSLLAACSSLPTASGGASSKWEERVDLTGGVVITDPAYVIGPEDALDISVWKDETLKASTLVRPDGGISFPLVGELIAAGKTADQVRDELKKRLEKYIPDAVVTVAVVHVASYRVYVLGRVNKPGDFAVGRDVDILQALTLAGGLTPFAHENDIRVVRKLDGKSVTIAFRYADALNDGDLSQNITLRSGDVVLVP